MKKLVFLFAALALCCTDFLITKGASADGSNIITYAADSHVLFGALNHLPAADHPPGTMRKIYDWDSGVYLGEIPEAPHTYNVIGNMNEHQVAIGESTFGGLESLQHQTGAIMDYGSLIYVALQRCDTARKAIITIGQLMDQYGYYSEGESFAVADKDEVWFMEIIGKGEGEKGAVWVARKLPDGYVSGHANQARIQTFPRNDPENCLYHPEVVSFAKRKGLYPPTAPEEAFSFSDTYHPVTASGARGCESRVWSFFRQVADGMDEYLDYVQGKNLTHRMPLWVRANKKISVNDTMNFMRDHFEGTALDFRNDVGAQGFGMPYRWRPLTWKVDGKSYLNERSTGTQQTGWSMVCQSRSWLPDPIGGLFWFGVDDTASSVYVPFYSGMTEVPWSWDMRNGDMMKFTFEAAFWVFNLVSNFAYTRYNIIHPEVESKVQEYENLYISQVRKIDLQASEQYKIDPSIAIKTITKFSVQTGDTCVREWLEFFKYLFTKYMDGNVKFPGAPGEKNPKVKWPGYPPEWYKKIVAETGDRYLNPDQHDTNSPLRVVRVKGM